ncbi:hypothetical protein NAP1_14278 [Erythrobacter sp. NAP1]|nr:hypothetical protein NAP1_14278 [Erythrobacter sp. NAP1]
MSRKLVTKAEQNLENLAHGIFSSWARRPSMSASFSACWRGTATSP